MKLGKTTRGFRNKCVNCGYRFDATTGISNEDAPKPGDASICISCGHVMIFGTNMKLRNPTDEEVVEIAGRKEIVKFQRIRGLALKLNKKAKPC